MENQLGEVIKWASDFFSKPFFNIFGGISIIIVLASFLFTMFLTAKGILPILFRLGMALSKRKIAIFALHHKFESLKQILVDSKIFSAANIIQIPSDSLRKAEKYTIFLVYWKDFQHQIDEILKLKRDSTALIIYAPQDEGKIKLRNLNDINTHRNSIVVNFRGRLLNDILISMITTGFEQRK